MRARDVGSYARKQWRRNGANVYMEPNLHRRPRRWVEPEVADWRRRILRRAGFRSELARELADDGDIDLHDVLELVDRGCPPELAARILAPL